MTRIFCIDGGATKTVVRAISRDGQNLGQLMGPSTSLNYDIRSVWDTLTHLFADLDPEQQITSNDRAKRGTKVFAAMAGTEVSGTVDYFKNLAPEGTVVEVISDGLAGLIAAHGVAAPGAVVSVGTGTVCFWRDSFGVIGRRGGWGFPLGDEGGGAWIGLEALRTCLAEMESEQSSLTPFSEDICAHLGRGTAPFELASWAASAKANAIAELAPIVFEHAGNNENASRIVSRATDHILGLVEKLDIGSGKIAMVGGLSKKLWEFFPAIRKGSISLSNSSTIDGVTAWAVSEMAQSGRDDLL